MSPEVHLALKPLLAEAAGEGLVAGVLPHVSDEIAALGEGFRAHHTLVGLLTWRAEGDLYVNEAWLLVIRPVAPE
jgi:hypothetical protein